MSDKPRTISLHERKEVFDPAEIKTVLTERIREFIPPPGSDSHQPVWLHWRFPLRHLDPLSWLSIQNHPTRIYWKNRRGDFETAGVGNAFHVHSLYPVDFNLLFARMRRMIADQPDIRVFGGFSFFNRTGKSSLWYPFGNYRFWIPRFEVQRHHNQTFFVMTARLHSRDAWQELQTFLLSSLQELQFDISPALPNLPPLEIRKDFPDYRGWSAMMANALEFIAAGKMSKIVLARKSEFHFRETIDALSLLEQVHSPSGHQYEFYFQPRKSHAFWGVSPERLYRRQGSQLWSEAIAGTRPRGTTNRDDLLLENELRSNEKELREHRRVMAHLRRVFQQLCNHISESPEISVLKLKHLQHLYWQIEGTLFPNGDDARIMRHLHPTPAVGGTPAQHALPLIRELEPFERGWYAAPVGWISTEAAEFAVAIRSALVHKNTVHVYAGAGIVSGSTPQQEWEEIENKITPVRRLLQG